MGEEKMTLQQLKYVTEVADRGSISETAKALFIAQPSLSAVIVDFFAYLVQHLRFLAPIGVAVEVYFHPLLCQCFDTVVHVYHTTEISRPGHVE
jgi:hypothetical protein